MKSVKHLVLKELHQLWFSSLGEPFDTCGILFTLLHHSAAPLGSTAHCREHGSHLSCNNRPGHMVTTALSALRTTLLVLYTQNVLSGVIFKQSIQLPIQAVKCCQKLTEFSSTTFPKARSGQKDKLYQDSRPQNLRNPGAEVTISKRWFSCMKRA